MKTILVLSSDFKMVQRFEVWQSQERIPRAHYIHLVEALGHSYQPRPDLYVVDDFLNLPKVEEKLADLSEKYTFSDTVNTDEFALIPQALANAMFNRSGLTLEQAVLWRDKVRMKESVESAGLKVPELFSYQMLREGKVTFPLVVKPRALAGAVGVEVVSNPSRLSELLPELSSGELSPGTSVLPSHGDSRGTEGRPPRTTPAQGVSSYSSKDDSLFAESYIPSPVFHLDGVVDSNGNVQTFFVFKYSVGNCIDYQAGHPIGSRLMLEPEVSYAPLRAWTERVLRALGLTQSVFHLECFIQNSEEPIFLELGARPGGGLVVPAAHEVSGLDLLLTHVQLQLGIAPLKVAEPPSRSVGFVLFPKFHQRSEATRVKKCSLDIPFQSHVSQMRLPQVGSLASGAYTSHCDGLAEFLFVGAPRLVESDMQTVARYLKIEVEGEEPVAQGL